MDDREIAEENSPLPHGASVYKYSCERCGYNFQTPRADKSPVLCNRCLRWLGKIFYTAMQRGNVIQPPISRTIVPEV